MGHELPKREIFSRITFTPQADLDEIKALAVPIAAFGTSWYGADQGKSPDEYARLLAEKCLKLLAEVDRLKQIVNGG